MSTPIPVSTYVPNLYLMGWIYSGVEYIPLLSRERSSSPGRWPPQILEARLSYPRPVLRGNIDSGLTRILYYSLKFYHLPGLIGTNSELVKVLYRVDFIYTGLPFKPTPLSTC